MFRLYASTAEASRKCTETTEVPPLTTHHVATAAKHNRKVSPNGAETTRMEAAPIAIPFILRRRESGPVSAQSIGKCDWGTLIDGRGVRWSKSRLLFGTLKRRHDLSLVLFPS